MKNTIKTILVALTLLFLAPSCSKSDDLPEPQNILISSFDGTYIGTGTYNSIITVAIENQIIFKVTSATTAQVTFNYKYSDGKLNQRNFLISKVTGSNTTSFTGTDEADEPVSITFQGTNNNTIVIGGMIVKFTGTK